MRALERGKVDGKYTAEVRVFAFTLHFFSPRGYEYVRNVFGQSLPSVSTIRSWYRSVNGEPGHQAEGLRQLEEFVKAEINAGRKPYVSVNFDEIGIKSNVSFASPTKKISGLINHGNVIEASQSNIQINDLIAKEALVYMARGIQQPFQAVVSYTLTNGLGKHPKAAYTMDVIKKITEAGGIPINMTFDGLQVNQAMCRLLGADFAAEEIFIINRYCPNKTPIYLMFDTPHMLKLVRNSLCNYGTFYDEHGKEIKYDFLKSLHEYQTSTGIKLAPKFTQKHVHYENKKMNVRIAAQTLSNSVAIALESLNAQKVIEFEDVSPTVKFIKLIDNIFDSLNSHSVENQNFKAPLNKSTFPRFEILFKTYMEYVSKLQVDVEVKKKGAIELKRKDVLVSPIKTGFFGILVTIRSTLAIYNKYVVNGDIENLLTFSFVQCPLEQFFSKVRSMNGFNNNPTAEQFKSAIRRLICRNEISTSSDANCSAIPLLTASSRRTPPRDSSTEMFIFESRLHHTALTASSIETKIKESERRCDECVKAFAENEKVEDQLIQAKIEDGKHIDFPCQSTMTILQIVDGVCDELGATNQNSYKQILLLSLENVQSRNDLYPLSNFMHDGNDHKNDFLEKVVDAYIRLKWVEICKGANNKRHTK